MKWNSFNDFRNEVIGKSIDYDGKYGVQCVDLVNKFWKEQVGRWVDCGGENARGIWTARKTQNAGDDFELIEKGSLLSVGDVVVFDIAPYGHCGFVSEVLVNNNIKIMDQNHNGRNDATGEYTMSTAKMLGAFRYKGWIPVEKPVENSEPPVENSEFKVGDVVKPTTLYDYNGVPLKQWDSEYTITQISGDRAVLSARGSIWAAMNTKNIAKV